MSQRAATLLILAFLIPGWAGAWTGSETGNLFKKMEAAYGKVRDYRAHLEVIGRRNDGSLEIRKLTYTFKKPNRIRMDFESPHPGLVLVYPDQDGKAEIRPFRWMPFWVISLDPNDAPLRVSPGQRIDQTDIGLLIQNISHSLTDWRRGEVKATESAEQIRIRVLSKNHFLKDVETLYQFSIDKRMWLPVGVDEYTPARVPERTTIFHDLEINLGIQDGFFRLAR